MRLRSRASGFINALLLGCHQSHQPQGFLTYFLLSRAPQFRFAVSFDRYGRHRGKEDEQQQSGAKRHVFSFPAWFARGTTISACVAIANSNMLAALRPESTIRPAMPHAPSARLSATDHSH
jgi:hypothetical protein